MGSFESLWIIVIFQPTHPAILHSDGATAIGDEILISNGNKWSIVLKNSALQ